MANSMEGQETIHSVCGPICHSIADMRLFVTSILSQKPWTYDSKVIPMPWRYDEENAIKEKISSRGLNLGYYSCDGIVSFTFIVPSKCLPYIDRFCLIPRSSGLSRGLLTNSARLGIQSSLGSLTGIHMLLIWLTASTPLMEGL
jgi:hypothetical protein